MPNIVLPGERQVEVEPSILNADMLHLYSLLQMFQRMGIRWIHLDIMDGHFVPNLSMGFPLVESLRRHFPSFHLHAHLMIAEPERYVERFVEAGCALVSVHLEAVVHLHRVLQQIRQAGAFAGVALNPHTPVHLLEEILSDVDYILIMSVNPGYGGQKFLPGTLKKLERLQRLLEDIQSQRSIPIAVDGGVDISWISPLLERGVSSLVIGSALTRHPDPQKYLEEVQRILQEHAVNHTP